MKKDSLFPLVCTALLVLFSACSSSDSAPSMELVISFTGAHATSATLVYGPSAEGGETATSTVTVSAQKATFTLSDTYADDNGWLKIYSLKVYDGTTLLSATTSDVVWFKFTEDSTHAMSYTLQAASSSEEITIAPFSLPADFIRGFDASEVDYYENEKKMTWTDTDGVEKDFFAILAAHGVNTVRLRIWNDPSQFVASVNTGMNDLARTVRMAKRVKAAGLSLMLDFHYSDTWADPGRQIVPAAWKGLGSVEDVASALSAYTTEVLTALKEQADVVPAYVQIGNEINPGMLLHVSTSSTSNDTHTDFAYAGKSWGTDDDSVLSNLTAYLKAGADAVREFDSSIKIVLHVASGGYKDWSWIFDPIRNAGVLFDIIGYSYYPWEKDHGTIARLKEAIAFQKERYNVDVIVAECSAHWGDDSSKSAQNYTYQHMINPANGSVYDDLEIGTSGNVTYVKGSVQNQANVLRHIFAETADAGGAGVFTWGGDMYESYKWGMFDKNGQALSSMDVFSTGKAN